MQKPAKLTIKQEKFCVQYVKHGDASRAYRESYDTKNMKSTTINRCSTELIQTHIVSTRIAELRAKIAQRAEMGILDVVNAWVEIHRADPNEIIRHIRRCCRYCYGINFMYQWIEIEYAMKCAERISERRSPPPEPIGGFGFDARLEPNDSCPMCYGEGVGTVIVADTEKLSKSAKALYGGLKQTSKGIEIIFRDQDAALENIAKVLGMFKEGVKLSGDEKLPSLTAISNDPVEAAKIYADIMQGD